MVIELHSAVGRSRGVAVFWIYCGHGAVAETLSERATAMSACDEVVGCAILTARANGRQTTSNCADVRPRDPWV